MQQNDRTFTTALSLILSGDAVLAEIVLLSLGVTLTALLIAAASACRSARRWRSRAFPAASLRGRDASTR